MYIIYIYIYYIYMIDLFFQSQLQNTENKETTNSKFILRNTSVTFSNLFAFFGMKLLWDDIDNIS